LDVDEWMQLNENEVYQVDNDGQETKVDTKYAEYIPVLLSLPQAIGSKSLTCPFTALIDLGSSLSWIHRHVLQPGMTISKVPQLMSQMLAGRLSSAKALLFSNTLFPELSRGK
jgi:hypothetical protein